jgi:hypothetical protein
VIIGALIEQWLMISAMNDIFIFHIFVFILWFVFGSHRTLLADTPFDPTSESARRHDAFRHGNDKVESWLVKLHSASDAAESTLTKPSSHTPRIIEVDNSITKDDGYTNEKNDSTEEIQDAQKTFLEFSGMIEVFIGFEDKCDVLTWMEGLVDLFCDESSTQDVLDSGSSIAPRIADYDVSEELEHIAPEDEELLTQHDLVSQSSLSHTTADTHVPTEDERWLATLLKQHEYPTFKDSGDLSRDLEEFFNHNFSYPIYSKHVSKARLESHCSTSWLGRPVDSDRQDIEFMLNNVKDDLPAAVFETLRANSANYWYRKRNSQTNLNVFGEILELQWYRSKSPHLAFKGLEDVVTIDKARIRQFRPACALHERAQCNPDDAYRAYLTDQETEAINEGAADFSTNWHLVEEVCQLKKELAANPNYWKFPGHNPIPAWLENMTAAEQLDPNVYDLCDCGEKAVELLIAYRNEKEHNYDPDLNNTYSQFPILFNAQEELFSRWGSKIHGKEGTRDDRIPRCQKILQCCELHETMSDNIFVLIDDSYFDINAMLSNPGGPFPAPGVWTSTYPIGFRLKPLFLEVPYESLPQRCIHGQLWSEDSTYCQPCYQAAHASSSEDYAAELNRIWGYPVASHSYYTKPSSARYPVPPGLPVGRVSERNVHQLRHSGPKFRFKR